MGVQRPVCGQRVSGGQWARGDPVVLQEAVSTAECTSMATPIAPRALARSESAPIPGSPGLEPPDREEGRGICLHSARPSAASPLQSQTRP